MRWIEWEEQDDNGMPYDRLLLQLEQSGVFDDGDCDNIHECKGEAVFGLRFHTGDGRRPVSARSPSGTVANRSESQDPWNHIWRPPFAEGP